VRTSRRVAALALTLGILATGSWLPSGLSQSTYRDPETDPLVETGTVLVAGRPTPFRVRHLPISSFPELPPGIADALTNLDCVIPQTYESHRPENVIHGSLRKAGSKDWAVLCSVKGEVSLLVFLEGDSPAKPISLSHAHEVDRLQSHDASDLLGFNWGIDIATPRQVHDAQAAMSHRPPPPMHDAISDSIVDSRTVYRFYNESEWETLSTE
jgi:hypothetical protein